MDPIVIDEDRLFESFDRVLLASRTRQSVFANYSLPHELRNLPRNLEGPLQHSQYLFYDLLYMQGGTDTEGSMRKLRSLYEIYPELFDPAIALQIPQAEITEMLLRVRLSHSLVRPPWWHYNSQVLIDYWEGDPREILRGLPETPDEYWAGALERLAFGPRKIMGAKEKITALFIDFLTDSGLSPMVDTPPAIDVRQKRFLGGTMSVWAGPAIGPWKELNAFRDACREAYALYCQSRKVRMNEIGNAVWYFTGEMCADATVLINGKGVQRKRRPLEEICGQCIVSDLCEWVSLASKHYEGSGGMLFIPRPRLPNEKPFQLDPVAPPQSRCTKHRQLWLPGQDRPSCDGCHGCDSTF